MLTTYSNVLEAIKNEAKKLLLDSLKKVYPEHADKVTIIVDRPPKKELGDLASPIGFQLAKIMAKSKQEMKTLSEEVSKKIVENISLKKTLFREAKAVGGYINLFIDQGKFNNAVIKSILALNEYYGSSNVGKNNVLVIEHTSANPIHPLHIGTARNSILGDSLARIFKFLGYTVNRRFYVDDMGKQVAYLVYGVMKLGYLDTQGKKDHWLGVIYSCINTILNTRRALTELSKLKTDFISVIESLMIKLESLKDSKNYTKHYYNIKVLHEKAHQLSTSDWLNLLEQLVEIVDELEKTDKAIKVFKDRLLNIHKQVITHVDWVNAENEIKKKWCDIFSRLDSKTREEDIEEKVSDLIKRYEMGDEKIIGFFKDVCSQALEGFKETLKIFDIDFDDYDWESQLVWGGRVKEIIERLKKKGWIVEEETSQALFLDIRRAVIEREDIREIFGLSEKKIKKAIIEGKEDKILPPNLALTRSDGTTLYTTRDIAYSIWKFEKTGAKVVLNVIGVDQTLAQKQIRAALKLAGYDNYAENLIHIAYELVTLPGAKFSSRRGRYVTFDELFLEAKKRIFNIIIDRNSKVSEEDAEKISEKVAVGAIKYALLSVSPTKKITFNWEQVLDFEQNSGPFIQYAYTRAHNILRKINFKIPKNADLSYLKEEKEIELVWKLAEFPNVVLEAAKMFRPDIIAEYANKLAQIFNSFYQRYRVLQAENENVRNARIALVEAYRVTMGNAMRLLGIPILERM